MLKEAAIGGTLAYNRSTARSLLAASPFPAQLTFYVFLLSQKITNILLEKKECFFPASVFWLSWAVLIPYQNSLQANWFCATPFLDFHCYM